MLKNSMCLHLSVESILSFYFQKSVHYLWCVFRGRVAGRALGITPWKPLADKSIANSKWLIVVCINTKAHNFHRYCSWALHNAADTYTRQMARVASTIDINYLDRPFELEYLVSLVLKLAIFILLFIIS